MKLDENKIRTILQLLEEKIELSDLKDGEKIFDYRGMKYIKPTNVSGKAIKKIVEISSGFDNVVQPFIDLLSSQLKANAH